MLEKSDYFGQYGKITKVVVNKSNAYNPSGPNGPSYSAYLTFSNDIDASIAILVSEVVGWIIADVLRGIISYRYIYIAIY